MFDAYIMTQCHIKCVILKKYQSHKSSFDIDDISDIRVVYQQALTTAIRFNNIAINTHSQVVNVIIKNL